jgi:hypothetical protein
MTPPYKGRKKLFDRMNEQICLAGLQCRRGYQIGGSTVYGDLRLLLFPKRC